MSLLIFLVMTLAFYGVISYWVRSQNQDCFDTASVPVRIHHAALVASVNYIRKAILAAILGIGALFLILIWTETRQGPYAPQYLSRLASTLHKWESGVAPFQPFWLICAVLLMLSFVCVYIYLSTSMLLYEDFLQRDAQALSGSQDSRFSGRRVLVRRGWTARCAALLFNPRLARMGSGHALANLSLLPILLCLIGLHAPAVISHLKRHFHTQRCVRPEIAPGMQHTESSFDRRPFDWRLSDEAGTDLKAVQAFANALEQSLPQERAEPGRGSSESIHGRWHWILPGSGRYCWHILFYANGQVSLCIDVLQSSQTHAVAGWSDEAFLTKGPLGMRAPVRFQPPTLRQTVIDPLRHEEMGNLDWWTVRGDFDTISTRLRGCPSERPNTRGTVQYGTESQLEKARRSFELMRSKSAGASGGLAPWSQWQPRPAQKIPIRETVPWYVILRSLRR